MKWVKPKPVKVPREIIEKASDPKLVEILYRRGFKDARQVEEFMNPESVPAPDFSSYPVLDKAAEKIYSSILNKQKICVWGDYDVDGVTATTLLVETLQYIRADVVWHVPNRFKEGYGLNCEYINHLADRGVNLLITCDCGISNHREIEYAHSLGMEVVVTDHHDLPPELPEADAVVNLKMLNGDHPARELPGAGTAFLVAARILKKAGQEDKAKELLDLVALAIIADVVPLTGENRRFLKFSLPVLIESPRLKTMYNIIGVPQNEDDIGFQIAPRLNAAGRIKDASMAVELLLGNGDANQLDQLNQTRKELVDECLNEIKIDEIPPVIILYNPGWHLGAIGIVAGRICEKYDRPTIVFTQKEPGIATGSARSIEGVHILDALRRCEDLLTKCGGHAAAAGCTLPEENIDKLRQRLAETIQLPDEIKKEADLEVDLSEIDYNLYNSFRELAPYGEANPTPVLYSETLQVKSYRYTRDEKHLQLVLGDGNSTFRAVWWFAGEREMPAGKTRAAFTLGLNRFNGEESLQLSIKDLEIVEEKAEEEKASRNFIDMRGADIEEVLNCYPAAQYFQEGPKRQYKSRYEITQSDTLVLLSVPPVPKIFKEILAVSGAKEVVLAYPAEQTQENYLKQLLGVLKFAVKQYSGIVKIPSLAVAISIPDNLLWKGLNMLQDIITYDEIGYEKIKIYNIKSGKVKQNEEFDKYSKEIKSFQRFMREYSLDKIHQYFI